MTKKEKAKYDHEYHIKNSKKKNDASIKWQKDNKEKKNKRLKEWRKTSEVYKKYNKRTQKNFSLKRDHGIGIDEYNKMFEQQNGCCDICGNHQSNFKKALFVDHNHETGKIRSLLCNHCNFGLGHIKEDIEIAEKMILYIKKHSNGYYP
jgi:hypothetical protein